MAKLLDLVDTHMKPAIYYLPDEALFVNSRAGKAAFFEHRKTVNPKPNQLHKIKLYDQMRKALISARSVHHKHYRGTLFSAVQRLFGLQGATTEFHRPLGKGKPEEIDESRVVRCAYRPRIFDRENTRATVETLPTGQAALLWIHMVPTRWHVKETMPLPADEHPQSHFKWAHSQENLPWNALAHILKSSPTHTLKTPSESPSSPDYQVWPAEAHLHPPISNKEVSERVFFMHVMPLFLESYGQGGKLARKLWNDGRRNDNLPVVFSWQEKYIWCIWRNGPHGPLEMQQTGDWIPEVSPGQRNYEVEQELLHAWRMNLELQSVAPAKDYDPNDPKSYSPKRPRKKVFPKPSSRNKAYEKKFSKAI
ncbi:uncharacterized protein PG998_005087 [Apiospora kogelbergensis]|uniref:uncharacterized protein n=1 Tax=Apiospora kogelbergensis TaxID=1337665 RepID=UPI00312F21E5